MEISNIILIAIIGVAAGFTIFFALTKKFKIVKILLASIGGLLVSFALSMAKSLGKFQVEAKEQIKESKENDKDRKNVTDTIEERIKKNKELINEIKNILDN